jgi:chromosome transmission fidelity protein 4
MVDSLFESNTQVSFQPGATPYQGDRRYLSFTSLGLIYTIKTDDVSNVSVEFHDRSQRPFHFVDHHHFDCACLGESGAIFSNEMSGSNPSTLFFKPFDSWSTKDDWTIEFDMMESAKVLALTGKGPVVATDQNYLRFFSYSGIQNYIRCLNGPIVSMAGSRKLLFIVYQAGVVFHSKFSFLLTARRPMSRLYYYEC